MAKELVDPSILDIVKAFVVGNLPFHTQDINDTSVGSPNGISKRITLDDITNYGKSKAIVVPVGTVQADALALSAFDNIADTVAAGTGVKLSRDDVDYEVQVFNNGANDLNVYPMLGSNFIGLADNLPFVITPGNGFTFKIYTATIIRAF